MNILVLAENYQYDKKTAKFLFVKLLKLKASRRNTVDCTRDYYDREREQ